MELTDEVVDGLITLWVATNGPTLKRLAEVVATDARTLEGKFCARLRALLATTRAPEYDSGQAK